MQFHQLLWINKHDFFLGNTHRNEAKLTEAGIGQVRCHYLKRDHVIKMSHGSQFNAKQLD